jgi:hypothetical protein
MPWESNFSSSQLRPILDPFEAAKAMLAVQYDPMMLNGPDGAMILVMILHSVLFPSDQLTVRAWTSRTPFVAQSTIVILEVYGSFLSNTENR